MTTVRLMLRAVLLAAILAVGSATPAGAALATESFVLRTDTVTGKLRLDATSTQARTSVRVRGTLRVKRHARIVLLRCIEPRCGSRQRRAGATRQVRAGRRKLDASLRTARSALVRVELRVGARRIAAVLLRPLAPRQPGLPSPPGPAPQQAAQTTRPAFVLSMSPTLTPAYDPAVLDYTVRCDGPPVRVTATVPADQTLTVDGQANSGGAVVRDVSLEQNQAFSFTVRDASGSHSHRVRCLPQDFPAWKVERAGSPDLDWVIFTPEPYVVIADNHGVPVWWYRTGVFTVDTRVLPDGSVVWGRNDEDAPFERHALDGTLLETIRPAGGIVDHHDIQQLPNGNRLIAAEVYREHVDLSSYGGSADATVMDAEIQEVNPAGASVWSWNSADHIDYDETNSWGGVESTRVVFEGRDFYDVIHINSFEQNGDGIVLSARHLNAVYRIRRSDGGIDWKLGGTTRPESLTLVGDPFGQASFGGQHDARILSDGSLTLHDNGARRGRPPRSLRYRLDTGARTAMLLEQMTDPRVVESNCCGSSRRLPGGHWLMSWGMNGVVTELTAGGEPVLTFTLEKGFSYRAQPVSSALVDRTALHAGMNAMHPRP